MRTKTLLITAALGAAGLMTASAQVYSVNAVGYVNLSLASAATPTVGTIIANPLNGTNNNLNTVLPLADAYDGTTIYRFDTATQNYFDSITFFAGFGWFSASVDPDALVVNPGEAFWIFPVGPNPCNVTFVGEVPQGALSNPLPNANQLRMLASIVPQSAALGDAASAGTLEFAAEGNDTVFIFDSGTQNYKDSYTYFDGFGWFSANADDPGPAGPVIPVATGFFVQKNPDATKTAWTRTFSVNP